MIVEPILRGIGEYVIDEIKRGIIVAAEHEDWSNETKFAYVFSRVKDMYKDIGDNALGITIKIVLADLKDKGHI